MDIRLLTGQGCRGLPVHREVRGQPPQPALEGGVPDHQTGGVIFLKEKLSYYHDLFVRPSLRL